MKKRKLPIKKSNNELTNRSSGSDFFIKNKPAVLVLTDGKKFEGLVPDWQTGPYLGEVVFNTGMTGYVKSLTDPSYTNQILTFTYPLIGNYGVQLGDAESNKIQVNGVVVSNLALEPSHSDMDSSLLEWLYSQKVPIITGVDTRELTKYLRTRGTMTGVIALQEKAKPDFKLTPRKVSIDEPMTYNPEHKKRVVLVDCGMKDNILNSLLKLPIQVKRVPYDYDYSNEAYDGVLISNGPGDPTDYQATVKVAKKALAGNKPVFGICLGTQIMALAAGAKTYKLLFGHRGHNQPCMDSDTNKCYITSQNHGYAIKEDTLPGDWRVLFRNLNDNSVEGIEHKTKPFFSVQFHPKFILVLQTQSGCLRGFLRRYEAQYRKSTNPWLWWPQNWSSRGVRLFWFSSYKSPKKRRYLYSFN